jgi:hypothetical protein
LNRALLALVFLPALAFAHHPIEEQQPGHASVRSALGTELEHGTFDFAGAKGNFESLRVRGAFRLSDSLEASAWIPFHRLSIDGAPSTSGPGDVDLGVKSAIAAPCEGCAVSVGASAELPTGDEHKGIGSGHLELSPFVSAEVPGGGVHFHGTLGGLFSIGGHHDHGPATPQTPNFVAPHADREIQTHLGVAVPLSSLTLNALVGSATALGHSATFPGTAGFAGVGAAVPLSATWRLSAITRAGIGAHRRYDWKTTLGSDWIF